MLFSTSSSTKYVKGVVPAAVRVRAGSTAHPALDLDQAMAHPALDPELDTAQLVLAPGLIPAMATAAVKARATTQVSSN